MKTLLHFPNIYKVAGDGGGGSHGGTDQVGASTLALATFKVAVAGRGAALAFSQLIAVHGDTHAASRFAPLETCLAANSGDAFFLGHAPYLHRARHDHRPHGGRDMFALDIARRHAQVLQARISAGSDEDPIEGNIDNLLPGLQVHILQSSLVRFALLDVLLPGRVGHDAVDIGNHARVGAPRDLRPYAIYVYRVDGIEGRARVACQLSPGGHRLLKAFAFRSKGASLDVREGGLVGSDHASARPGFDGHVAEGHASFHGEATYSRAAELNDVACTNVCPQLANDGQRQVFGSDAGRQFACDADMHRLRTLLQETLRGKDLLDFAGTNTKGQRSHGPVGRGMRIAAHDGHSR